MGLDILFVYLQFPICCIDQISLPYRLRPLCSFQECHGSGYKGTKQIFCALRRYECKFLPGFQLPHLVIAAVKTNYLRYSFFAGYSNIFVYWGTLKKLSYHYISRFLVHLSIL